MNLFFPFAVVASWSIFLTLPSQAKASPGSKLSCRTNLAPPSRKSPISVALDAPASDSAAQALSALNSIKNEISQRKTSETGTEPNASKHEDALIHLNELTLQIEQAIRDENEGKDSPSTIHFIVGQAAIEKILGLALTEQIKRNPSVVKLPQPIITSFLALLGIWTAQGEQILGKISQYVDFQGIVNDGLTMMSSSPVDLSMQGSATLLVSSYAVAATANLFSKFFRNKRASKNDVVQNQDDKGGKTGRSHDFEISRHVSLKAVTTDQAQNISGLDLWTVTSRDPSDLNAEPEQLDIVLFSKDGEPALVVIRK
ncbi:MAG: hypothetical protein IPJ71_06000 [Bdellovibrionales bacterium]|nr:hypothetical protein [Bdellovibrionales bacterium]